MIEIKVSQIAFVSIANALHYIVYFVIGNDVEKADAKCQCTGLSSCGYVKSNY